LIGISWNVRRIRKSRGWQEFHTCIDQIVARHSGRDATWSFICLQEPGKNSLASARPHVLVKGHREWGSAVLVNSVIAHCITHQHLANDWVAVTMKLDANEHAKPLCVISAHLPPSGDQGAFDECLGEIQNFLEGHRKEHGDFTLVLGIDANVELPVLDDVVHCVSGPLATGTVNERSMAMLEFMCAQKVVAVNTFPQGVHTDLEHSWTFEGTRKQRRLIDYVCCRDLTHFSVDFEADCNTDHNAIAFDIPLLPHSQVKIPFAKKTWKKSFKGWKPCDFQQRVCFAAKIEESTARCQTISDFQTSVLGAVKTTRGTNQAQRNALRLPVPPELTDARAAVAHACSTASRRTAARALMRANRKFHDMQESHKLDRDACFGMRVSSVSRHEVLVHDRAMLCNQVLAGPAIYDHYATLFNPDALTPQQYNEWYDEVCRGLHDEMRREKILHIDFSGFLEAIHKMRGNKATGLDGICNEMVQNFTWNTLVNLHRLFEQRLNSTEHESIEDWKTILVYCIAKKTSPTSLSHWRPISLLPTLQKLFAATLAQKIDDFVVWPTEFYGFMEGKQTLEVTSAHRFALTKAALWNVPLFWAKIDVRKAFDSMKHKHLFEACIRNGLPLALTRAILREHYGLVCEIHVGDFQSQRDVPFLSGGKQGGRHTPKLWNLYLLQALKQTMASWRTRKMEWHFEKVALSIAIWADDIVVYAASFEHLKLKLQDLLDALCDFCLDFKDEGLCWSCDSSFPVDLPPIKLRHRKKVEIVIPFAKEVVLLGTAFDQAGTAYCSLRFRLKQAWQHWHERRAQLCRRRVPYKARVQRFFATVAKTLLFGAGDWQLATELLAKMDSFMYYCLRSMLGRRRSMDTPPWIHATAINLKVRKILTSMGQPVVSALALKYQHGWAGHLMRFPEQHPAKQLLITRDAEWWEQEKLVRHTPGRPDLFRAQRGRPCEWEYKLVSTHGVNWKRLCPDRQIWKALEEGFVRERQWELGHDMDFALSVPLQDNNYKAAFWDILAPAAVNNSLAEANLIVVSGSGDLVDATLGKNLGGVGERSLYRRLTQAHFILTAHCGASTEGCDSILLRAPDEENWAMTLARSAALLGSDEHVCNPVLVQKGDTFVAYHSGAGNKVRGGAAYAILLWREGLQEPLVVNPG
jgi:hypothetical protein